MCFCPGRVLVERNVIGCCSVAERRAEEKYLTYRGCRRQIEPTRIDMLAGTLFERSA